MREILDRLNEIPVSEIWINEKILFPNWFLIDFILMESRFSTQKKRDAESQIRKYCAKNYDFEINIVAEKEIIFGF